MSAAVRSLDGYENGKGFVLIAFGGRALRNSESPCKLQRKEKSAAGSENGVDDDEPSHEHYLAVELILRCAISWMFRGGRTGVSPNDPLGSRPEPGTNYLAPILLLPPGEVPEGRARGVQDTASQVKSESVG